jgi:hypothetical protein
VRLRRLRRLPLAALVVLLLASAPALANHIPGHVRVFPGTDPNESVRINTPNDPEFDRCEIDNEDGVPTCSHAFDQQFERFGFASKHSENSAVYSPETTSDPHIQRLMQQNTLALRNPVGQVSGVSADRAWKYSTGDPDVQVAILDTGIRWNKTSLRKKVWLNHGELPTPQHDRSTALESGVNCASYTNADDANGDGAFNVSDYACDSQVSNAAGHDEADSILDGSDLIAAFSRDGDEDNNGYVDDIVGWDFFDDDNDPYDASSYSSAGDHGSGRAEEAGEQTNDGDGGTGVCPQCQIVPMRVWDTFVVDTNNFAQAALYATDNEIEIVEGAVGGLFNSKFARSVFDHAYRNGTFFAIVSSDLNTADHNIPRARLPTPTGWAKARRSSSSTSSTRGACRSPPTCRSAPGSATRARPSTAATPTS